MADAVAVSIAKAVEARITDLVAANELSQRFTLERSYADWDLELKEMDRLELKDCEKLRVDVVTHTTEQEAQLASRGVVQYTTPIDMAIRRKFGPDKLNSDDGRVCLEEIDALLLFTQELHLAFTKQRLTDFQYAVWDEEKGGTRILVAPDRNHLRVLKQFTAIIRVVFRADISLA